MAKEREDDIVETAKEAFVQEVTRDASQLNLAYAALLMAAHLDRDFDIPGYLARIETMAEALRGPVALARSDEEVIDTLNDYLFRQMRFYGNAQDYYSPDNSFLNKVLDQRRGIPISLSVIYLETGWRLGLPLWGIGLPGHFVVGYGQPAAPLYIDVFNEGRLLDEAECLSLGRIPRSSQSYFKQEFLKPVTKKAILLRMLLNLKQIYVTKSNWEAAYRTVDLMLVLEPSLPDEVRDRGLLARRVNRLQQAVFDLQRYLFLEPDNPEAESLKRQVEAMETELLRLN